jgi:hypothetical protein
MLEIIITFLYFTIQIKIPKIFGLIARKTIEIQKAPLKVISLGKGTLIIITKLRFLTRVLTCFM